MAVERTGTEAALIEVLGRVLDKGIVYDAWDRLGLAIGNTRLTVASVDIQRTYGELAQSNNVVQPPPIDPGSGLDELGVCEPLPHPKPPRAGGAAVNPYDCAFDNDTAIEGHRRAMDSEPLHEWPDGYVESFSGIPDNFARPPQAD